MRASGTITCSGIIDGTNGTDGYNTVVVPLYRRSASVLTDNNRPSGPLTYTFSTGRLTGASTYFNGWSQTIPTASANTKLYVIMAVARSQSDTDEIAATDWSTPVEYVADGMSSAPVFIYKRAASQPTDKPADGAVYTFATGALTGTLNGWSTNIPATDNNHYPCWVRQAMAVSRGTTDTINADEWSNPATKMIEDGKDVGENLIDNSLAPFVVTANGNPSQDVASDKTYELSNLPSSGTAIATQAVVTLNGCALNNDAHILVYGRWGSWQELIRFYPDTSNPNQAYKIKDRVTTLSYSDNKKGDGKLWVRLAGFQAQGTVTIERVKMEIGDKSSAWSLSENDKRGATGKGVVSTNIYYKAASSTPTKPSGAPANNTDWVDNGNSLITNDNASKHLYESTCTTYTDGTYSWTTPLDDGLIQDMASTAEQFALADSGTTAPTSGWGSSVTPTAGKWIWSRTVLTFKDGSTKVINTQCVGYCGTNGKGISSADIMFCLGDSQTQAPGDSSFTVTTFAGLNISSTDANKFVWQCIKTTYTSGDPTYSGKVCLGKVSDFASVVEQYALGSASAATSSWRDNTPPSAEKGKYLWTRTKLTYSGGGTTYIPSEAGQCVGYFGNDGAAGYSIALTLIRNNLYTDANWNTYAELGHSENYSKRTGDSDFTACRVSDYFVVTGTSSDSGKNHTAIYKCTSVNANSITGTCVSHTKDGNKGDDAQYIYLKGSAFNKDSGGTNVAASEIKVNGGSNLATQSRGLCLVTLNRQTLAVVDSATIYDTYEGTTGKNNLITKLNNLGTNVFVCLVSYDAIGWSDTLISLLQTFGMSDLPYTSANRYPFLFIGYKNLGKGNGITRMNDMAEPAIPVELGVYVANGALSVKDGKDGEDGDDAVTYQIVYSEAWAKVNSSNSISARLRGHAYKIVGSTRTAMAGATIMMGYVLNNTSSQYPNIETTTDANGYFSENDWFNGDEYGSSGYVQGSQVIFAAIIVGTAVKCVEYVTMTLAGAKGDTGRMYYIAGKFPEKAPYTRTAKLCPVVYYSPYWWYLDADSATGSDTPSDSNSSKWKKLENYGVVLTDAIFVKNFAQFGAAIITGDWLISVHGMIGNTYYGGSVENPDEYNDRAAYTYFDPAYPWGYDPFQLPVKNEEVETEQNTSWTRITDNFKLPAGTYTFNITCYVNSSDYMHLRLYNGDNSSDDLYLGGTGSDETVTLTYTRTLTSSQNWNLRATMNASGENGYVVAVEVVPTDARFIPNYAVDLRTGKTYQSDAHIKGAIQCIGPTSKITIEDGVIRMFGAMNFPNIVLGVNEDGCAVLNFYDKNGNFKYGLGPDEIFRTKSQAESMTLKYYNVDAGSDDCTSLLNSAVVMLYLYMFKNQITNDLVNGGLYKYLAKIASGVYGPGSYCASSADAQKYNEKIIKYGYSMSAKLKDSDVYSGGGIVVTSSRTQCGIITRLSNMLNGESVNDLDYRGYNVMQDSDFNKTKEGTTYYFRTKDTYNPVQAFYWDSSYPSSSAGGIGYENAYSDKYWLNLCTNPADDETLIDPVYYFNLQCIDSNGTNKGLKTLYINRMKLKTILQNAGYSL